MKGETIQTKLETFHKSFNHPVDADYPRPSSIINKDKQLRKTLIEEEYRFWSYCEGKQGECLQPDTKYLDGYWHPNYDINHSL